MRIHVQRDTHFFFWDTHPVRYFLGGVHTRYAIFFGGYTPGTQFLLGDARPVRNFWGEYTPGTPASGGLFRGSGFAKQHQSHLLHVSAGDRGKHRVRHANTCEYTPGTHLYFLGYTPGTQKQNWDTQDTQLFIFGIHTSRKTGSDSCRVLS